MSKDKAGKPVKSGKGGSAILPCGCANKYQDARYGQGLRVANVKEGGREIK